MFAKKNHKLGIDTKTRRVNPIGSRLPPDATQPQGKINQFVINLRDMEFINQDL